MRERVLRRSGSLGWFVFMNFYLGAQETFFTAPCCWSRWRELWRYAYVAFEFAAHLRSCDPYLRGRTVETFVQRNQAHPCRGFHECEPRSPSHAYGSRDQETDSAGC